jgi:hypothetical protein
VTAEYKREWDELLSLTDAVVPLEKSRHFEKAP